MKSVKEKWRTSTHSAWKTPASSERGFVCAEVCAAACKNRASCCQNSSNFFHETRRRRSRCVGNAFTVEKRHLSQGGQKMHSQKSFPAFFPTFPGKTLIPPTHLCISTNIQTSLKKKFPMLNLFTKNTAETAFLRLLVPCQKPYGRPAMQQTHTSAMFLFPSLLRWAGLTNSLSVMKTISSSHRGGEVVWKADMLYSV